MNAGFFQFFEEFEAAFSGHDHIGEDEIEMLRVNEFAGAKSAVADGGFVARETKSAGEGGQGVGVMVDQKEIGFARHVRFSVTGRWKSSKEEKRGGWREKRYWLRPSLRM